MRIRKASEIEGQDFTGKDKFIFGGARDTRKGYLEDFAAFDTEFTTVKYEGKDGKEHGTGLLYYWTFCLFGEVYAGRTIEEFVKVCDFLRWRFNLNNKRVLVIYVHNLSADFCYIYPYFKWLNIFATDKRHVLRASTGDGLEFRCSLRLTNMSLKKFLENEGVKHQKQDGGKFDYKKLRTPETWLTAYERYYAACDVLGLYEGIHSKMERDGDNIVSIPMTSTGYVRRDCREACLRDKTYRLKFKDQCLTLHQYELFKEAFRGGNTHANRAYSGFIMQDIVSYDISSSYPAAMLYEKYPASKPQKYEINSEKDLEYLKKRGYGFIIRCKFLDLCTDDPVPYLSISKCILPYAESEEDYLHDNGRILSETGWTETVLTDVDYEIVRDHYEYSDFECVECYYYRMKELPKPLRETISEYFVKKTKLKGIEGQEYYYTKAKNNLNSCYGMMVMDLVRDEFYIDEDEYMEWKGETPANKAAELERYYKSRNSFLHYQWGVYVTAYARRRLQEAIDICGNYIVYCDTDSVKFIREEGIIKEIEAINDRIGKLAMKSETTATAKTEDGKVQTLGIWDLDAEYDRFLTYGAKKYCYSKHGKFSFTVSGLGKQAGGELKDFDDFVIGRTYKNSGRTYSEYDDEIAEHYIRIEGRKWPVRTNMAILDTTYTLGITDEYKELLDLVQEEKTDRTYAGGPMEYVSSAEYDPE